MEFATISTLPTPELEAQYKEAIVLYDRNEPAAAAELFERILAAEPRHLPARYKFANALKEQGRLDEATAQYGAVLGRDPRHAESLNNLGAIYEQLDLTGAAETFYLQAMHYKPDLAPPYINLGRIMQRQQRRGEAALLYRRALQRGLDAGLFGHLLAAVEGQDKGGEARAPAAYVRETFDAFAAGFEHRVVDELGYRVPQLLAGLIRRHAGGSLDVLDLGCGTGLVGSALSEAPGAMVRSLVGVDLSPRMIEEARGKGCYASLHAADIGEWLAGAKAASFDVVAAADVFIYVGDLQAVFRDVNRVLRPGGLFAFSVETCVEGDFALLPTGRYAQSGDYLGRLVRQQGMMLLEREATEVRAGIAGELYLLRN